MIATRVGGIRQNIVGARKRAACDALSPPDAAGQGDAAPPQICPLLACPSSRRAPFHADRPWHHPQRETTETTVGTAAVGGLGRHGGGNVVPCFQGTGTTNVYVGCRVRPGACLLGHPSRNGRDNASCLLQGGLAHATRDAWDVSVKRRRARVDPLHAVCGQMVGNDLVFRDTGRWATYSMRSYALVVALAWHRAALMALDIGVS